jgi:hypothetical protein
MTQAFIGMWLLVESYGAWCKSIDVIVMGRLRLGQLERSQIAFDWVCSNCHRDRRRRQIDHDSRGKLRASQVLLALDASRRAPLKDLTTSCTS